MGTPQDHSRRPRLVVAAIIHHPTASEKVLITKRTRDPAKNVWHLPGGAVEFGESLKNALLREIREELRVAISLQGQMDAPVAVTEALFAESHIHAIALYYRATLRDPRSKPVCGDGTAAWVWANPDVIRGIIAKKEESFLPASASALRQALGWDLP